MRTLLLIVAIGAPLCAQHTLSGIVRDSETAEPLAGVNLVIKGTTMGTTTDAAGRFRFANITDDALTILVRHISYETLEINVSLPVEDEIVILLKPEEHESEEITITTTRSSRTIDNTPTRVEAITGEELDEKATMRAGDIRMQLNESTGIQVQQTSAASGNATFKIQGLDGRYTQLLRDGFPLYSEFSSGLSIMQIPPLDLRQIEIVKGSASTLYGGGAIAGIVNLISRTPEDEPVTSTMVNATTAGGLDASLFHAARKNTLGWTVFTSFNGQRPYDANDDRLTDIPEIRRITVNPRLFWSPSNTRITGGVSLSAEVREGGDIKAVRNRPLTTEVYYVEKNVSDRISTQFSVEQPVGDGVWTVRNSVGRFRREISVHPYKFKGRQLSSFSELTYAHKSEASDWIVGASAVTEDFDESNPQAVPRDQSSTVVGFFLQETRQWTPVFQTELGLRADRVGNHGFFTLPRAAVLITWNTHWSSRVGGGFGYKTPSIFNEKSEQVAFREVRPLAGDIRTERSYGGNADVNYRDVWGPFAVAINQLFYYTRLDNPTGFDKDSATVQVYRLTNLSGHIDTHGFETNARISLNNWKWFFGYTFVDARRHFGGSSDPLPLVARHKLGSVFIFEVEDAGRAGLEFYYTGRQHREDGSKGQSYWVAGFMVEKKWDKFSVYVNFENFLDTRQSRFEPMFDGDLSDPMFRDIYAPVEGFVANAGIKVVW